MRWAKMSQLTLSISRLSVYSVALTGLLVRAEELGITPEDRERMQFLVLQISQYLFSQASRTTTAVFRERRQLAFDKLGFNKHSDGAFVESLPLHGPFLFAGQLLDSVDQQISMRKRAAALASQLKPRLQPRRFPSVPPFRGGVGRRRGSVRFPSTSERAGRRLDFRSSSRGFRGRGGGRASSFRRPSSF